MALRQLIDHGGNLTYSVPILSRVANNASKGDIVLYGITIYTTLEKDVILFQNGQCLYSDHMEKTWSFTSHKDTYLVIQLRNRQGHHEQLVFRTYLEFSSVMDRLYRPITIVDRCRDYVAKNRVVVYEYIADLFVRAIDMDTLIQYIADRQFNPSIQITGPMNSA